MIDRRGVRQPVEELEFALHRLFVHALLLIDLAYSSRLYRVINPTTLQPLILATCAAIIVFYSVYLIARGTILPVILAAGYVWLIFNQIAVFADRAWIPFNANTFFQYIWLLTFVPFAGICMAGERDYLLKWVMVYGTAYCGFYALASTLQTAGLLPGQFLEAIVSSDVERGARIYMYLGLACLAYFYWLTQIRKRRTYASVICFSICLSASLLSLSRVYILIVILLTILFLAQPKPALMKITTRLLLIGGSAFVLSGMLYPSFNPFAYFSNDSSGSYRAFEYEIVRQRVEMSPFWGFGLSATSDAKEAFLGPYLIFSGDLGPLGVWFDFGVIGLAGYAVVLWKCSQPQRNIRYDFGWPLFLTGAMMAAYGFMAPLAVTEGGSTMTGLIVGLGLASGIHGQGRRTHFTRIPWPRRIA